MNLKALFNAFNRGRRKVQDSDDTDLFQPSILPSIYSYDDQGYLPQPLALGEWPPLIDQREHLPWLPPDWEWPPPNDQPQRSGIPPSTATFELRSKARRPRTLTLLLIPHRDGDTADYNSNITTSKTLSGVAVEESTDITVTLDTVSHRVDEVSAERSSHEFGNGKVSTSGSNDVLKNVASIPTAATLAPSRLGIDHPSTDDASASNKNTVVRSPRMHPRDSRGPTSTVSTAALASRTDVGSSKNGIPTVKATTPLPVRPPKNTNRRKLCYGNDTSIRPSHQSRTPFSQKSNSSVLSPDSWDEAAGEDHDLVANRPRERIRQQVLWEIVASEEGYVSDLFKMKEAFIEPLLHPIEIPPKSKESFTKANLIANDGVVPYQIPDDLRRCLEAIEGGILDVHCELSKGLRKRYDKQFPLVWSLADVFVTNSHILRGYADYVLHLERALEQVNNAILISNSTKRPKNMDNDWLEFSAFLRKLEVDAQDRGETGLAIFLSKPFQRLLKYPLLLQNLLFYTNPPTSEHKSILQMVAEVDNIVCSIQDENIQKEERSKTRDILARIEGLDKVKQLAGPKRSRFLVEERMLRPRESSDDASKASLPPPGTTRAVRGKTFKRLSDALQGDGGDIGSIWLVVFNDIVLRCRRTGVTRFPLGAVYSSWANPLFELQGGSKLDTTGRRFLYAPPRNLYKFIKIENWAIDNVSQPRQGVVSMEDVFRSRAQINSAVRPISEDDEDGSVRFDASDGSQDMSVSYWIMDKAGGVQKSRTESQLGYDSRKPGSPSPSLYPGSSLANAKFGSRLVSENSVFSGSYPPSSRPTVTTPSPGSVMSDEMRSERLPV